MTWGVWAYGSMMGQCMVNRKYCKGCRGVTMHCDMLAVCGAEQGSPGSCCRCPRATFAGVGW